jgi:hypothetical protein
VTAKGSQSLVTSPVTEKLQGPGESSLPRPFAISTKDKHLLAIDSIPTRGFTAVVSVFRAHLLRSP